jgi:hypothetical protein
MRIQFGLRGWAAIVAGLAILAAIALLAIGLFIFILPVLILAPVFYWLVPRPKAYRVSDPASKKAAGDTSIIDGEFRVIDAGAPQGNSEPTAL